MTPTAADFQLSYAPASPFARLVRLCVAELGLTDRVRVVPVQVVPGQPDADYVGRINPLGRVPALTLADGSVLVDSHVIAEFLDDLAGGHRLIPAPGGDGRARHQALSDHAVAQGAMEAAVALRYETAMRPDDKRWTVWIDDLWAKIARTLDWFEAQADTLARPRAAGPVDLVQASVLALVGYLDYRFAERGWRDGRPRLAAWAAEAMRRDSFTTTDPDAPVG